MVFIAVIVVLTLSRIVEAKNEPRHNHFRPPRAVNAVKIFMLFRYSRLEWIAMF